MITGRFARLARAGSALTAALTIAGAATAAPAFAETGPDLKITATVEQGRWLPGDAVPVEVTVTNTGDATATKVHGAAYTQSGPFFYVPSQPWGDLEFQGPGGTFAPGGSRTYHLLGSVSTLEQGNPVVEFTASGELDVDYADNSTLVTVPLLPKETTDRIAGHLFGDRDRDGKPSAGEENLAGAEAHVIANGMSHDLVAITDAAGRFAFDALPVSSSYSLHFEKVPGGWVTPPSLPQLRLDGSGANTALEVATIRPLSDVLTETITLDKQSYAVGQTGTATVTLQNTGDQPLADLYAGCDPGGFGQELDVPHEQWGAFDPWHPAGKLAPGERVVLKVSGEVPERAAYSGRTGLGCYIDDGKTYNSGPYTFAGAKVPGKKADAKGRVWIDKNGNGQPDADEGVAKTTVALTEDGGHVVSLARTDAAGFATFTGAPVGSYHACPLGPWTTIGDAVVDVTAPPFSLGDWSVQVARR
ncbi:SdrD B-like domain-containing protein [Amycolatopsis sp. NPDC088138]|uniref:SdrD B-like domain-containing protein n=1 Tax=Amycolatopsis sp. NPDC088138 TaxID=3363938 RepID=UPI00381A03C6